MPMESTRVNRGAVGGWIEPECTRGSERLDVGSRLSYRGGDLRRGSEVRRSQPVVADHALLVRVGDGAGFQRVHGLERVLHRRRHALEKPVVKPHPAHVERQADCRDPAEVLSVAIPKIQCRHCDPSFLFQFSHQA